MKTKCEKCGFHHYTWSSCLKVFEVRHDDYHGKDDWEKVEADDSYDAARKWCDKRDARGDYEIIGAGGIDGVQVRDADGVVRKYIVVAYTERAYYPREKE